jgi:hypothetical protein
MSAPGVGSVVNGVHGAWVVVGPSVLTRVGNRNVWEVPTRYECRHGGSVVMVLTVWA